MNYSLSYSQIFWLIMKRDLLIAGTQKVNVIVPILFFVVVVSLFPLGIGPEPMLLSQIASGVIWVCALLATLLSLDRLFKIDQSTGVLEQLLLLPCPLFIIILSKIITHWILTGLPLILITPMLAVFLFMPENSYIALISSLIIGTPLLSLIGGIGAALTLDTKNSGVLMSLIILPLYIPVLIFSTSAVNVAAQNVSFLGQLAILGSMLVAAILLAPIVIGATLRINQQ